MDSLVGGMGDDLLAGGAGGDVYRLSSGFGNDVIDDPLNADGSRNSEDGQLDAVEFDSTIAVGDVLVYWRTIGNVNVGYLLVVPSTGDSLAFPLMYAPGGIEFVRFADGTQWQPPEVEAKASGKLGSDQDDTLSLGLNANYLAGRGGNDTLTGSAGADTLDGGTGNDSMTGLAGDDTYYVDSLADKVVEVARRGIDTVIVSVDNYTLAAEVERLQVAGTSPLNAVGNALNNTMIGNSAANRLDGGAGSDTMTGGAGDDVYVIGATGDTVVELASEGIDRVETSVTTTLSANVENLTLTGTGKINGIGNELDNWLVGNSAINKLNGGAGSDRLDGGAGADAMTGGEGDDVYVVDSATDTTIEIAGGGVDTVESGLTRTLATEVERLVLTGTAAINGTGNALVNWLIGNAGANVLNGAAGGDVLQGLAGNDTLQDTSGNSAMDGGVGNDTLVAGSGADLLAGGVGNDTLTLGAGADIIAFNQGDGADLVNAPLSGAGAGERNDTLSLGGVRLSELALAREGTDLVFNVVGTSDSIRFKDWYLASTNQTVSNLQVVVDSGADYLAGLADGLGANRVVTFDFAKLTEAFDAALATNPAQGNWQASDAILTSAVLRTSDSAALGGSLAYGYAHDGALGGVSYTTAVELMGNAGFGLVPQAVDIYL